MQPTALVFQRSISSMSGNSRAVVYFTAMACHTGFDNNRTDIATHLKSLKNIIIFKNLKTGSFLHKVNCPV